MVLTQTGVLGLGAKEKLLDPFFDPRKELVRTEGAVKLQWADTREAPPTYAWQKVRITGPRPASLDLYPRAETPATCSPLMSGTTVCLEPNSQWGMELGQLCVCTYLSIVTKKELETEGKLLNASHHRRQTYAKSLDRKKSSYRWKMIGSSYQSGGAWGPHLRQISAEGPCWSPGTPHSSNDSPYILREWPFPQKLCVGRVLGRKKLEMQMSGWVRKCICEGRGLHCLEFEALAPVQLLIDLMILIKPTCIQLGFSFWYFFFNMFQFSYTKYTEISNEPCVVVYKGRSISEFTISLGYVAGSSSARAI